MLCVPASFRRRAYADFRNFVGIEQHKNYCHSNKLVFYKKKAGEKSSAFCYSDKLCKINGNDFLSSLGDLHRIYDRRRNVLRRGHGRGGNSGYQE